MHRSGTSALTGALASAGVFVGDDDELTGKSWENPQGFFERRDARNICDALLHGSGADWWKVSRFSPDNADHEVVRAKRSEIGELVSQLNERAENAWALKEPRLCVLLPIFRSFLSKPFAIIVARHPVEVARSLRRRNGFPIAVGMALWEAYMCSAMQHAGDLVHFVVRYDEILDEPERLFAELFEWLEQRGLSGLDATAAINSISPELRRERARDEDGKLFTRAQKALWKRLSDRQISEPPPVLSSSAQVLLHEFESDQAVVERLRTRTQEQNQELKRSSEKLDRLQSDLQNYREKEKNLDQRLNKASGLEDELAQAKSHIETLKSELAQTHTRLEELEPLRDQLGKRAQELAGAREQIDALQAASSKQEERVKELEPMREEAAKREAELAQAEGHIETLKTELAQTHTRLEELEPLRDRLGKREQELAGAQEQIDALQAASSKQEERVRELEPLREEAAKREAELAQAEGHIETLKSKLAQTHTRLEELEPLRDQLGKREQELAGAREEKQKLEQANLEIAKVRDKLQSDTERYKAGEQEQAEKNTEHEALLKRQNERIKLFETNLERLSVSRALQITNRLQFLPLNPLRWPHRLDLRRRARRIIAAGLFDSDWYLKQYPDIRLGAASPVAHYLKHGSREGRWPHPVFDPHWYASQLEGKDFESKTPVEHYLVAAPENRVSPHPLFDEQWYLENNPDVAEDDCAPLTHFLLYGGKEGRSPHRKFDAAWYLEQNPDVAKAGVNPLLHFLRYGEQEGRSLRPLPQVGEAESRSTQVRMPAVRVPERAISISGKRCYEDLNGNVIALNPVPAFGNRDYELVPSITGPVLVLSLRKAQFPISLFKDFRVAVHLHLHHSDLCDEFATNLANIPIEFTLFVSITKAEDVERVKEVLESKCLNARVLVRPVPNRGRDIASLVTEFASELKNFEYFAHFHSKRSPHNAAKADWRRQLLHGLIGSEALVQNIFSLLAQNPQIGMVFPEYHWSLEKQISWGTNFEVCRDLAERTGLHIRKDRMTLFPAGSMFWARVDALDTLLNADLKLNDFSPEKGQVDGTTAHAIERLFGEFVSQAGYQVTQIKPDRQHSLSRYFTADWPYSRAVPESEARKVAEYQEHSGSQHNRIAIFSAIVGGYDAPVLHEVLDPQIDYFLFTDRDLPDMGFWKLRNIDYYHPDPVRRARWVKTHAHRLLSGYDIAIWIDANVLIRGPLDRYIGLVERNLEVCLFGIPHPHRHCMYEEAASLEEIRKDLPERIARQVEEYKQAGFPAREGLIETNFLLVNLLNPDIDRLMRAWWGGIVRFSHRDQLSVNFALWSTGTKWQPIFSENQSLRSHKDFAYFGHGTNSGWPATPLLPGTEANAAPVPMAPIRAFDSKKAAPRPGVDIVVCVHDALDDVKHCLLSVVASRRPQDNLVIVDDASARATADFLDQFKCQHENVAIHRNQPPARGYCRAANVGMRSACSEFVLLLNSDAVLPRNGIDKLVRAAASHPDVAVVGPMSNAASFQSIPDINSSPGQTAVNSLPEGYTVDDLDRWCEDQACGEVYASVPLIHGFCQLIRKSVLDQVGIFDEAMFPEGYGEENDFCFRVAEQGWELLVAIDTYVYHRKSASYSDLDRRQRLMKQGSSRLRERYGNDRLSNAIAAMQSHPALQSMRGAARQELQDVAGTV